MSSNRAADLTVPPNVARKCVTVSVGGTTGIIKDEESWLEVLNTADEALYMAKKKEKVNVFVSKQHVKTCCFLMR